MSFILIRISDLLFLRFCRYQYLLFYLSFLILQSIHCRSLNTVYGNRFSNQLSTCIGLLHQQLAATPKIGYYFSECTLN